jgi:mono/diheme cytochrome c family protein
MNLPRKKFFAVATIFIFAVGNFSMRAQSNDVSTASVYVPDYSHAAEPLPDGVLAWDALIKSVDSAADDQFARFSFSFTNVTTNLVTILNVHPSCGCTTAELPPVPWVLAPGTNGEIKLSVSLAGKTGMLFKTVNVATDHGQKTLTLRINILPPVVRNLSPAERAQQMAVAKIDRQAVFKGDCASCHVPKIEGKYGANLYNSICGICHEAQNRATMVPDLHHLKVPTNQEFWRTWITLGKPGSLMPAFAASQGGPLSDMQIASLAMYLNQTFPSNTPLPQ